MTEREYYVYRYRDIDTQKAEWDAVSVVKDLKDLPKTIFSNPGLLRVIAHDRYEAIQEGKDSFQDNIKSVLIDPRKRGIIKPRRRIQGEMGSYVEPAVMRCKCGHELNLESFTNTCEKCDRDYNDMGHLLAPRSQWGEETGESLSDILGAGHYIG